MLPSRIINPANFFNDAYCYHLFLLNAYLKLVSFVQICLHLCLGIPLTKVSSRFFLFQLWASNENRFSIFYLAYVHSPCPLYRPTRPLRDAHLQQTMMAYSMDGCGRHAKLVICLAFCCLELKAAIASETIVEWKFEWRFKCGIAIMMHFGNPRA